MRRDLALVALLLLCAAGPALAGSDKDSDQSSDKTSTSGTHASSSGKSNSGGQAAHHSWHRGSDHQGGTANDQTSNAARQTNHGSGGWIFGDVIVGWPVPDAGPDYPVAYPDTPEPNSSDLASASAPAKNGPPPWPFWYYCDQPSGYYPYVQTCEHDWTALPVVPPPPGSPKPMSYARWEWCKEANGYFPYVLSCPSGWSDVAPSAPASERDDAATPPPPNWYYCDAPKGYAPYVQKCSEGWRPVPAMPPANAPQAAPGH